jgi:hypothetical protein
MKRRIAASLGCLLWALFTYLGYEGMASVTRQHAPGYPSAGQWHYYVYFPLTMLAVSAGLLLLARKLPQTLFVALWALQVAAFIPFFLGYTGGV